MKEELEKLGFVTTDGKFPYYILDVNDDIRKFLDMYDLKLDLDLSFKC